MKRFFVFNAGCIRRGLDSIRIQKYLESNGWTFTCSPSRAELIVIATCGVVLENERNSLKAVSQAARRRARGSTLVVTGCLPNINREALRELGDFVFVPTGDIDQLDRIVLPQTPLARVSPPDSVAEGRHITNYLIARSFCRKSRLYKALFDRFAMNCTFLAASVGAAKALGNMKNLLGMKPKKKIVPYYNIAIARGCLSSCTFCATKLAIGPLRSRPQQEIVDEFLGGLQKGYRVFQLIAEDTGCYGLDIGSSFPELLGQLLRIEKDYKLNIIDYHPRWLVEQRDTLVAMLVKGQSKIKEIFLPLQSGSDRILERMGRGHTAAQVKHALRELKDRAPCISLRAGLLVGFPGESDEDFEATKELIRDIRFDEVTVNRYEDRPNTDSSRMDDKVDQNIIEARARFLAEHMNCHILS